MIKKKRIREQCTSWLSTLHSNQPYCRLPKWQDHRNSLVTAFSWCEYSRKTKECGDYKQVASFSSVQKDPWEDMNIKTSANIITSGVDSLRQQTHFRSSLLDRKCVCCSQAMGYIDLIQIEKKEHHCFTSVFYWIDGFYFETLCRLFELWLKSV